MGMNTETVTETITDSEVETFTLGTGAKLVGVSKPTLRTAFQKGLVTGELSDDGQYTFQLSELLRYKASREESQQRRANSQVPPSAPTPATTQAKPVSSQGNEDLIPREMHETVVASLHRELQGKDKRIEDFQSRVITLESDKDQWRHQATAIQNLLTDQRQREPEKIPADQEEGRGKIWILGALLATVIVAVAAYWSELVVWYGSHLSK